MKAAANPQHSRAASPLYLGELAPFSLFHHAIAMTDEERAYATALRLLGRRWYAEGEIRKKLKTKGFAPDLIASTIERLRSEKWLDDTRFAEAYARTRLRESYGGRRITQELEQRGVDAEIRERALSTAAEEEDERSRLASAAERRLATILKRPPADQRAIRDKLVAFLVRRGFGLGPSIAAAEAAVRRAGVPSADEPD